MIIEYKISTFSPYSRKEYPVVCCGQFKDWDAFKRFSENERLSNRIVSEPKVLKE